MRKILLVFFIIILLFPVIVFAEQKDLRIDESKKESGYIVVEYSGPKNKVIVFTKAKGFSQNIEIEKDKRYILPLPYGDGVYSVSYCEDVKDNKCNIIDEFYIYVKIKNELTQYLSSNIWVDIDESLNAVKKGKELTKDLTSDFDKIKAIYKYVTKNISYDKEKAKILNPLYSPNVDDVLKTGKGICSDYASLMAVMLRSQGIPTKVVTGTMSDGTRHAWVSVYSNNSGTLGNLYKIKANEWSFIDASDWFGYFTHLYFGNIDNEYLVDGGF